MERFIYYRRKLFIGINTRRKTMSITNRFKQAIYSSGLALALATASLDCGSDPSAYDGGGTPADCCTSDPSDAGSPDRTTNHDAGNPDANTICTTTPSIQYTITGATFDSSGHTYKAQLHTPVTVDACATTNADRYRLECSNPQEPVTTDCSNTYHYTTPGTYTHTIEAWNNTCKTTAKKTLDVTVEELQNQPPVARAGPDMTIQSNQGYCFYFGNEPISNISAACAGDPFAPGHSANGTGSYDPNGDGIRFKIYQAYYDPTAPIFNSPKGILLMEYSDPGTYTVRVEVTDTKNASAFDETIVTVQ